MLRFRVFFPILYVLVVKFIFVVVQIPDWHWPPCQSGSWKNAGKGDIEIVKVTASKFRWPGATATCPMGKKVIGGGAECSSGIGFIWLVRSIPVNNNAWYGYCDTTENIIGKITVHAICQ
ncbi:shufflon protein B [Escherichia coli]